MIINNTNPIIVAVKFAGLVGESGLSASPYCHYSFVILMCTLPESLIDFTEILSSNILATYSAPADCRWLLDKS